MCFTHEKEGGQSSREYLVKCCTVQCLNVLGVGIRVNCALALVICHASCFQNSRPEQCMMERSVYLTREGVEKGGLSTARRSHHSEEPARARFAAHVAKNLLLADCTGHILSRHGQKVINMHTHKEKRVVSPQKYEKSRTHRRTRHPLGMCESRTGVGCEINSSLEHVVTDIGLPPQYRRYYSVHEIEHPLSRL